MSEEGAQAVNAAEQAHRYSGAVGVGEEVESASTGVPGARTVRDQTPEERAYNRQVFGVTYRERYGQPSAECVTFCRTPGQRRRGQRCPCCYGPVAVRPIDGADIDPEPGRAERFAAWVGGLAGAFADAMLYPFRVGRAHTEALVRDILQEAMAAGLSADIPELGDILQVLEGIEGELRAIRTAADAAGERAQ